MHDQPPIISIALNNFINIQPEFKLKPSENVKEEKKYTLRSSISNLDNNAVSIVRNKNTNDFYKLMINNENEIEKEKIEDISRGFIYFYEIEKNM
mgnify:CR=1 FL=1